MFWEKPAFVAQLGDHQQVVEGSDLGHRVGNLGSSVPSSRSHAGMANAVLIRGLSYTVPIEETP